MASIQPAEQTLPYSPTVDFIPTSLIRFNSARVAPEKTEDDFENSPELRLASPSELQIDEVLSQSFSPKTKTHSTSRISPLATENDGKRVVTISEYRAPENTPFEPLTKKPSSKKLHRYILVTPHTLFSISLFTILSLAVVIIGFGIAISYRQSQLNSQCSLISYCPTNTSYIVLCNITTENCGCYNTENELIGCIKQRQYGQGCYRSQECSGHHNLQCNMAKYQCQCLDHYFYNGSLCIPMLTYGDTCSPFNDTCDYSLNLKCLTGNVCTCSTAITFWNGEYCESYRVANSPCDPNKIPSGCSASFVCANSTATCQCSSAAHYDGTACLSYSSYLEPCYDASTCLPNSQLSCLWGLCQCDDSYYYWSPLTLTCVYPKQITYNSSCNYQTSCESDFGLRCINGRCVCELSFYWTPGNYCDSQSQYNEQCSTAPCLGNTGLICSANTSTCTCSQYYFWDGYVCQYQRTYSAFCLADNWCYMNVGLRCRNSACSCSLCTTCFWDGTRCRDCPTSWQIVVSNGTIQPRVYCYLKVDSYVNWNESATNCSTAATSYFGNSSHLIHIDDYQELQDVSTFATSTYYDIFIGHTNRFNYSQWFLTNGTVSPSLHWCAGVATTFSSLRCSRLLIGTVCVTDIVCYGWTSRYICELD